MKATFFVTFGGDGMGVREKWMFEGCLTEEIKKVEGSAAIAMKKS